MRPWPRALFPAFGAVLLVAAACGDDGARTRSTGEAEGGAGSGGAASTVGGSSATSSGAGEAGQPSPGAAGLGNIAGVDGGAGEAGSGPGPDGLSFDDFCELVTVRARQWFRDCRNGPNAEDWWGTVNVTQLCSSGRAAVEAGRLVYDPVKAKACALLTVGACGNTEALAYGTRPQNLRSTACVGVLSGTLALDDECHPDSTNYADECAQGFCAPSACPSTCTAYAEAEEACDGVTTICDPATLFCNAQNQCQAFLAPGEPCPGRDECAPGDVCHGIDDQTYLCTTPVAIGQDCDETNDVCAERAVCLDGKCTAKVALGEPCQYPDNCPEGAFCSGTCRAYVQVEGDCSVDNCAPGLLCTDSVCVAEGHVGEGCPCEVGLWCDETSKCRAPGEVGDDCSMSVASSCPVPLFCHPQTLKCTELAAENESCSMAAATDSCEPGLHCVCTQDCATPLTAAGTCEPRGAIDADCSVWHDCASGICTQQKCAPDPLCY
jgi:hypothetical protein